LIEWRLAEYLLRSGAGAGGTAFVLEVSHTGGRPILFLPDRAKTPGIPEGWQRVLIDDKPHEANFVKVAVNVVRAEGGEENVLPAILRGWFGPDAGRPGTSHSVVLEQVGDEWTIRPSTSRRDEGPELFKRYSREQIPRLFGAQFSEAIWNSGFVLVTPQAPKHIVLLVTLDKGDMTDNFQ